MCKWVGEKVSAMFIYIFVLLKVLLIKCATISVYTLCHCVTISVLNDQLFCYYGGMNVAPVFAVCTKKSNMH
jgi:hypothetical protein